MTFLKQNKDFQVEDFVNPLNGEIVHVDVEVKY